MLKENDTVRFTYLKEFKDEYKGGQVLTDYTDQSEEYSGKIVDVRNIIDSPVSSDTVRRANIKGRRSEVLYTVELADGAIKSFYEGRMVGTEVLPETKRELFSLIASALFKGKTQTAS
tara:strand:- start:55 stop:408 length:354 start_codon:yes stop_codon:yes gene_type:complete